MKKVWQKGWRIGARGVVMLVLGVAGTIPVVASNPIWVGNMGVDFSSDFDWNTGANWSTGKVPGANDDVTIGLSTFYNPIISSGNDSIHNLLVGTIAPGNLTINSGAVLIVGGSVSLAQRNGVNGEINLVGTLQVGGANAIYQGSGFANFSFQGGTIRIAGGDLTSTAAFFTTLIGGSIDTNGLNATIYGPVNGPYPLTKIGDGTLTFAASGNYGGIIVESGNLVLDGGSAVLGEIILGDNAGQTASAVIQNSANITAGAGAGVRIGSAAGSNGLMTITGANTVLNYHFGLDVGEAGTGTLNIVNGATIVGINSSLGVGHATGGVGTVLVDGPGSTVRGGAYIGYNDMGTGYMTITNGGAVIGGGALGSGTVIVTGANSTWLAPGEDIQLGVGSNGIIARMSVLNGATVSDDSAYLGDLSFSAVTIDGVGSKWENAVRFEVSVGNLTISNGGQVSAPIGILDGAAVLVTDSGSSWIMASDLGLNGAPSNLTIANGGTVANANGSIGIVTTSSAYITGANSQWVNQGNFSVGDSDARDFQVPSHANLTVANGGALIVTQNLGIYNATGGSAGAVLQNGYLRVGGTVSVGSGTLLQGTGWVGGNLSVSPGATLSPGNQGGALVLTGGNVTLSSNATLNLEIVNGAACSQLLLTGNGRLTYGGKMIINFDSAISTGLYKLFDFAGEAGNFSSARVSGAYSGNLTGNAGVWTGTFSGVSITFNSTVGQLQVANATAISPAITTQPQPIATNFSSIANMNVVATGGALTYQWYEGVSGDTSNPVAGAVTASFPPLALTKSSLYWVQLKNSAGISNSPAAMITVLPPSYGQWGSMLGLTGANAAIFATPFGDSIPNLLRYAMNLSSTHQTAPIPIASIINGVNYLTTQYRLRKNLTGVTVVVQVSADLANWVDVSSDSITQMPDDDMDTARYQATVQLPAAGDVFLRLVAR